MIAFKGGRLSPRGHRTGLGKRFIPLMRYLADGPRGSQRPDRVLHFATRHLPADTPKAAGFLMACCAEDRKPDFELPVYHVGASAAVGEKLTPGQWEHVADLMLTDLGLTDHESAIVVHDDTKCQHVHIVVNRIGVDCKAFRPWKDYPRMRRAMRRAERHLGLQVVAEPLGHNEDHSAQPLEPSAEPVGQPAQPEATAAQPADELARSDRRTERPNQPRLNDIDFLSARESGVQPLADAVRERALGDFLAADSWDDLELRLSRYGLRLEPARRGGGVVVWTDLDEPVAVSRVAVSKIDRRLSGPKLAKRFGEPFAAYRERVPEPAQPDGFLPVRRAEPGERQDRVQTILDLVQAERATFTEQEVRRHVRWQHDQDEIVASVLDDPRVERIGLDDEQRPIFTTAATRRVELELLDVAGRLRKHRRFQLDTDAVRERLDRDFTVLADEQRDAVLASTTRSDLALIAGRAGSSKTTLMQAIVDAYRDAGMCVQGAALTGKAAEKLGAETGIDSRTLAALRTSWAKGRDQLDEKTVLLVDEAGMLGTRQMGELLATVERTGAKAILVGSPDQMHDIEVGDAFVDLLEKLGDAPNDTNRRDINDEQARSAGPEPVADDPVKATLVAVGKLRDYDAAVQRLGDIDARRSQLAYSGDVAGLRKALTEASGDAEKALLDDLVAVDRLDQEAKHVRALLDGGRDARVAAVLEASRNLGAEGFARLDVANRAFLRALRAITVETIEEAVQHLEWARDEVVGESASEATAEQPVDDRFEQLFVALGTKAALAAAPPPIRRAAATAFTVADLVRDTPQALLRTLTPRTLRRALGAVRVVAHLIGDKPPQRLVEPPQTTQQPRPQPWRPFTVDAVKPPGADKIFVHGQGDRARVIVDGARLGSSKSMPRAQAVALAERLLAEGRRSGEAPDWQPAGIRFGVHPKYLHIVEADGLFALRYNFEKHPTLFEERYASETKANEALDQMRRAFFDGVQPDWKKWSCAGQAVGRLAQALRGHGEVGSALEEACLATAWDLFRGEQELSPQEHAALADDLAAYGEVRVRKKIIVQLDDQIYDAEVFDGGGYGSAVGLRQQLDEQRRHLKRLPNLDELTGRILDRLADRTFDAERLVVNVPYTDTQKEAKSFLDGIQDLRNHGVAKVVVLHRASRLMDQPIPSKLLGDLQKQLDSIRRLMPRRFGGALQLLARVAEQARQRSRSRDRGGWEI